MILVPEIETVVILVPRTGTTALKNALLGKYPKALLLYRHMEADGVPRGYDRWRKVGVLRDPVARLWSLYKFLREMRQEPNWHPGFAARMNASATAPFDQWLVENETVFTHPYWGKAASAFGQNSQSATLSQRHAKASSFTYGPTSAHRSGNSTPCITSQPISASVSGARTVPRNPIRPH